MKGKGQLAYRVAGLLLAAAWMGAAAGCAEEQRAPFIQIPEADKIAISGQLKTKLKRIPLHLKWDTYVLGGQLVRNVFMEEDLLFIETASRQVWAMDRNKGVIRWAYTVGYPLQFPPTVSEDLVYFISRDVVHAVFRNGGDVKWKKTLPFVQGAPPAANRDFLFVAAGDTRRFYAFKEKTQVPETTASGEYHGALEAIPDWFFNTDDYIRAAPVEVTRGTTSIVYLCSLDHKAYALNGYTGKATWSYKTGQQIIAAPYVRGDHIFIPGQDHTLHCLDRYGGPPPKWLFPTGGPMERTPAGDDEFVYARAENVLDEYGLPEDPYLYAIEIESGKERWRFRRGVRMLISGEDKVYILREGRVLVILEKRSGKFLAEYPLPDFQFVLTNDKDDVLYLITDRGFLFALQESDPKPFK